MSDGTPQVGEPTPRTAGYQVGRTTDEVSQAMDRSKLPDSQPLLRAVVSASLSGWALG